MKEKTISALEYARAHGYPLNYVYQLLAVGSLPGFRENGRWRIPVNAKRVAKDFGPKPRTLQTV